MNNHKSISLRFLHKLIFSIYYAFYVVLEGIFKVSHSWPPVISIAGIFSLLITLPFLTIIRLLSILFIEYDIPKGLSIVMCVVISGFLGWVTYRFFLSIDENAKQKFLKDKLFSKLLYGTLAIIIAVGSFCVTDLLTDLYVTVWKNKFSIVNLR